MSNFDYWSGSGMFFWKFNAWLTKIKMDMLLFSMSFVSYIYFLDRWLDIPDIYKTEVMLLLEFLGYRLKYYSLELYWILNWR